MQIVPESIRAVSMRGLVYRPIKTKGDNSIDLQGAYRRDETSSLLSALLIVIREFSPFVATSHREVGPKSRRARMSRTKGH